MKKIYVYLFLVVAIVVIGLLVGPKIAGFLGVLGIGGAAVKKKNKKKSEELSKEKNSIETDIDKLIERKKEMEEAGEERSEEYEKIKSKIQELKKKDKDRKEKANQLNNKMKDLLIIFILVPGLLIFSAVGMAQESNNENSPVEDQITIEDISIPDNYNELLAQHKEVLKTMIQWRNLYYEERKDKQEALKQAEKLQGLYEKERNANEELQNMIDKLNTKTDRLIKIVETHEELLNEVLNSQSGSGFGLYGGVNYTPLKPLNSGIEGGISIDF